MNVKLDKDQIQKAIAENFGGFTGSYGWAYYLAISPKGQPRVISAEGNRQWDPWHKEDFVFPIPAPYGDGSGELSELAEDMLRDTGRFDEAKRISAEEDKSWIDLCDEWDAERWNEYQDEALSWYANEWLAHINGEPNDLEWGDLDIEHDFKFSY